MHFFHHQNEFLSLSQKVYYYINALKNIMFCKLLPKRITVIKFAIITSVLFSCSGERKTNPEGSAVDASKTTTQTEALSTDLQEGLDIYKRYCLSCHQMKGNGVSGMYPPLAGNPDLKGPSDSLIYTVLRGKAGKIEVNGTVYSSIMAPHNYLTDEQVASVLNYLLHGMNKFSLEIHQSEVTAIRKKLK
jgi:mono/diheme cytochrome c family protein